MYILTEMLATFLVKLYEGRWIEREGPVAWPGRSPHLNPCGFCQWGYLTLLVYTIPVETHRQLWARLQEACQEVRSYGGIMKESLNTRTHLCLTPVGPFINFVLLFIFTILHISTLNHIEYCQLITELLCFVNICP